MPAFRIFIATCLRTGCSCSASHTSPIPPSPKRVRKRYGASSGVVRTTAPTAVTVLVALVVWTADGPTAVTLSRLRDVSSAIQRSGE